MIKCNATAQGRLLGMDNAFSTISDEQVAEVRRLRAAGWTYQAIAQTVGCSLPSAWAIVSGSIRSQAPARILYRVTVQDYPQVAAMHAQGNGYESIAKLLGATSSSIRKALSEMKKHTQWNTTKT